jgi:glyoxylase-like metal-dependent hydrolase (beta-lactamase superfamily II)
MTRIPIPLLSAVTLIGALSLSEAAPQNLAPSGSISIEIQRLKDNLYVLSGGGGNSAVFVTDLGVVLVDTKPAGSSVTLLDKIKTITTKPVTTIINTHAHADHVGGNEAFPTSVEIIAQENTRLNLDKLDMFKGQANFLPKLVFKEKMALGSGKDRVDLYYFGRGHTGGDAWVVFPALRVAHAGDMLGPKGLPAVDFANGGSVLEYSETLARAASTLTNVDTIITGHGPLMSMSDFKRYVQFNKDFRDAVVSGYNHGLGLTEVAEAWRVPDKYRGYETPPERTKADVQIMFGELNR